MRAMMAVVMVLSGTVAGAQAQLSTSQQKCLNTLNKGVAKLQQAQAKENLACLKAAGLGKLPAGQSADACLVADGRGKVGKVQGKLAADYAKLCAGDPPAFGLPAGSVASVLDGAARDQSLAQLADILGASLANAAISCAANKAACRCQQAIAKGAEKLAATSVKTFLGCQKAALKAGATSAAALADCIADAGTTLSIAADAKGKLDKQVTKLAGVATKQCAAPVDTAVALPGWCAGRSGAGLASCVAERVACRVCLTLNLADGLAVDCDAFDDGAVNLSCPRETFTLKSLAEPADTPGSPGVSAVLPALVVQQGSAGAVNLNNARYTRYRLDDTGTPPDAILILVPGFEGGANDFKLLAENLIPRVFAEAGQRLEVWAYDRRSNQLEDTLGLDIAEAVGSAQVGLDWLFGSQLGLPLSPELVAVGRRAVFFNGQADTAFIANWTPLTFSRDIDAIVEKARTVARQGNVFLGGHSAGTGFAARYAATDFNFTGTGPARPGHAKLRGLVLLEGAGGATGATPSSDTLDRIEAKFDGGLFGAVRANAARCVDGLTPCTIATELTACAAFANPRCTLPTTAYATSALLNAQILAAVEPAAIQGVSDPDGGQILLQVDQGAPGNNAVAVVPELATLAALPQATVFGGIGSFIDDDGFIASLASFVATSVGAPGPVLGGLTTWLDTSEVLPPAALPHNGPPPTTLPGGVWGQEVEPTRFDRMLTTFFAGHGNFTDWYYPSSGLGVTSVSGVCSAGTCTVGNVGAGCSSAAQCSQAIGLDSSALSIGRGRRDIENLTQAAGIAIPVIGFGGSNGLVPVPARFVPFAQSIGPCTAPSCSGAPRVVDATLPNPAFPTFGDVAGGFEVHISEGYAHVDVLTAEDDATNNVLAPLSAFLARNTQ